MKTSISRILISLLLVIAATGCNICKIINRANNQEFTFNSAVSDFKFVENQILIETSFSKGKKIEMLFDLGAPRSAIFFDTSLIDVLVSKKPISSPGKNISTEGIKMKNEYYQYGDVWTKWFRINKSFISTSNQPNNYSCNELYGLWGADLFVKSVNGKGNKIVILNMQNKTLGIMDSLPPMDSWIPIETKYNKYSSMFSVKLAIGSKYFYFYFDTGFSGSLAMSSSDFKISNRDSIAFYDKKLAYGYLTNSLSGPYFDTAAIVKTNLRLNEHIYTDSVSIISTKALIVNIMGMEYLKRFNILIDYDNAKLYFQSNINYRKQPVSFFASKGFVPRNTIKSGFCIQNIIVNSIAEKSGLKIGDEIISINQIRIDQGDPCEVEKRYSTLDGSNPNNEIIVKRGDETLKFIL